MQIIRNTPTFNTMKRRTFLQTLTALVAAPALPATAVAAPSTAITQHFAHAKLLARCHDRASPEMFARLMKLEPDAAQGVFDLLRARGVIGNGADGIARAVNPLNTHCVPNEALRARDLAKMTSDLAKDLRARLKKKTAALREAQEDVAPKPENEADAPLHDQTAAQSDATTQACATNRRLNV